MVHIALPGSLSPGLPSGPLEQVEQDPRGRSRPLRPGSVTDDDGTSAKETIFHSHLARTCKDRSIAHQIALRALACAVAAFRGGSQALCGTRRGREWASNGEARPAYSIDSVLKISATWTRRTGAWSTAVCQTSGQ